MNRAGRKHENACRSLLRRLQCENGSEPDRIQALKDAGEAFEELARNPDLSKAKKLRLLRRVVEGLAKGCLRQNSAI